MSALATAAVFALLARPECGAGLVPPDRMVAVVTVESGRDPLAIGVNGPGGGDLRPASVEDAVAKAKALLAQGRSIDLGLTQINSFNLARHGLTVETAFDACASLRAGAEHLAADLQAAWRAAHSRYNTGDLHRGIDNGYAGKIERVLNRVVVSAELPAADPPPADPPPTPKPETEDIDLLATARARPSSLMQLDNE